MHIRSGFESSARALKADKIIGPIKILFSVFLLNLIASSALAQQSYDKADTPNPQRPIRDKWALVVGIGKFKDKQIPELRYASKDAFDFAKFLVEKANFSPDHVRVLLDSSATQRRVMSELGSKFLHRLAQPDDLVVLFFSTHGSPAQVDRRGNNLNYLVAYDSDPDDLFASGIEMQKILDSIHRHVLTDRVLLVLDACHSGTLNPNAEAKGIKRVGNFNAEDLAQGSGQLVVCSSMPEEKSWESRRYENGVFTRQLLNALGDQETLTLADAYSKIKAAVANEVKEDRRGALQTPVLNSKWNGNDLRISVLPSQPQNIPITVKADLEIDDSAAVFDSDHGQTAKIGLLSGLQAKAESEARNSSLTAGPNVGTSGDTTLYLDPQYFSQGGDPKQLIRGYTAAIRANPKDPELMYKRAVAYIQVGDWMKALNDLSDAQVNTPTKWHFYLARSLVYHKLGQPIQAIADLDQAKFYNQKLPKDIRFK